MAGHSKWANIKHRKAAQDARRGKIFTKIIRELSVAAKAGALPEENPRLRAVIDKALSFNMKKDTIEKVIQRSAGGTDTEHYDELTYEGYAPGGVAVFVEAMTDNRNRTVADVRHAFTKHGGNLGTDGSVAFLFEKVGLLTFAPGLDDERVLEVGLDAGAEDVVTQADGSIEARCAPEALSAVLAAFRLAGLPPEVAEITRLPATLVDVDEDTAMRVQKIIDMLEDLDDVQNVYSNLRWPETPSDAGA